MYMHFITALCDMARNQKRINTCAQKTDNEKYAFRWFLLRLGFIGAEYKTERKILLRNLTGSSAFKGGRSDDNDTKSICYEIHQKAKDIIEGRKIDHTFYPVIYGADESDDWTDPEVWKKANPSLGITVGIDKVHDAYESAKQNPGEENAFRQLRLNQWVKQTVRWMPMDKWDRCSLWRNKDLATIGLDMLHFAKITEDENGEETYGTPEKLAKAISADLSVELVEAILYADDGIAEIVKEFGNGTLSLGIDDIGSAVASTLTGATIDSNGVVISASEDGGEPVAIGFRAKKSNGKYKYFWLYKVKFGIPATNLATKGESITFSTPTIEGTIMRRNKVDGRNKHPWKAEVTEGDTKVSVETITNWYKSVYEPEYSA